VRYVLETGFVRYVLETGFVRYVPDVIIKLSC
jgi:hypothetical protein